MIQTKMLQPASAERIRRVIRVVIAMFYFVGGIAHLTVPDAFLPIVPAFVPFPRATIAVTGLCEIAGAVSLFTPRLRWWAGLMLAIYAACVFPANLKHATQGVQLPSLPDSWWYHGPRLFFQPALAWMALFAGSVIDWPLKPRPAAATKCSPRPRDDETDTTA